MSKVLVTGAAGFIGSNLVDGLLKNNFEVVGLDNLSTGSLDNLKDSISQIEFHEADIRDKILCDELCKHVDYILHHAAYISVPGSFENPIETHDINVNGTLNLLQCAAKNNVKRFVHISSAAVHGDTKEDIDCISPYAYTKYIGELYAQMFHKNYNLKTLTLRYYNVFGKRQSPTSQYAAAIPIFINKVLSNEQPIIYGDGLQTRDFTHVSNIVDANIKALLADDNRCGKTYEIGMGHTISINETLNLILQFCESNLTPIYKEKRIGDIKDSVANISSARLYLKYKPTMSFEQGLEETIEWLIER
jgi:nucleoside-diphosphate-sugar epimerase